jgi:hypothetical protein
MKRYCLRGSIVLSLALFVCGCASDEVSGAKMSDTKSQSKKHSIEDKKTKTEELFEQYKEEGDKFYMLLMGDRSNVNYKNQAKYYYALALSEKEDAGLRNRYNSLVK